MKVQDLFIDDRKGKVLLKAKKRKENNPVRSKTTKHNSFIDVFGGMAGYPINAQGNADSSTTPG